MKRIVVADIHGNWTEIQPLLDHAGYTPNEDVLVFVGDYCDHFPGGSKSTKQTLDTLIELGKNDNAFFLLGDHDLWMRDWLRAPYVVPAPEWFNQGGEETLLSYGIMKPRMQYTVADRERIPESHRHFINTLEDYYIDDAIVCVHGGFTTNDQMKAVKTKGRLMPREVYEMVWDRDFIFSKNESHQRAYRKHFGDRHLITGHTAVGPVINHLNPRWVMLDSSNTVGNLHAFVLEDDTYKIIRSDGTRVT